MRLIASELYPSILCCRKNGFGVVAASPEPEAEWPESLGGYHRSTVGLIAIPYLAEVCWKGG